ncbi:MAG: hypothetical protein ACK5XM_03970 [Betaproteobacteria bacterium]
MVVSPDATNATSRATLGTSVRAPQVRAISAALRRDGSALPSILEVANAAAAVQPSKTQNQVIAEPMPSDAEPRKPANKTITTATAAARTSAKRARRRHQCGLNGCGRSSCTGCWFIVGKLQWA